MDELYLIKAVNLLLLFFYLVKTNLLRRKPENLQLCFDWGPVARQLNFASKGNGSKWKKKKPRQKMPFSLGPPKIRAAN